ncbi:DUF1697 domain-containing protein [Robertkochia solimangrovi]|uniref:DUF1697 domain-containing protein n=1 Tax=Robertkochia solimangrovi TaxID=2213046 RepID=UPI00117D9B15|nr:DUF1697 domain-containing protein [Robertkochia solimangrovi]TRZ43187.1 DUF1697 domain-containing protein [Robertkochia solimangrovi]
MFVYIALLRGINVSGHNIIKMADLRNMFEGLGFSDITTYVQSGNVVFSAAQENSREIENSIESKINDVYGYEVPVMILTKDHLNESITDNPFLEDAQMEEKFFHITFLSGTASTENLPEILEKCQPGEALELKDDKIYLYCPNGYGRTKLNNNFLEKKLGCKATTRNWKTVNKLSELAAS